MPRVEDREDVQLFVRCQLDDALSKCSPDQVAFFRRLYGPVVPKAKLAEALDLVERTIRKNEKTGRWPCKETRGEPMNRETTAKLAEIGHQMCTQNNRITAEPLFVVQQKRRIWGIDTDYDPEIAYMWRDDSEYTYDSREAAEEYLREGGYDLDRFDDLYREVGYIEIWEFVTAHLTERAAQRYIDENNHNLHNPRIYVTSQYRCDEFNFVANALRGLGHKLHKEPPHE